MFRKFKIHDYIMLISALLSLIYSEVAWFRGEHETAIFVGIWVPSIITFGIYINNIKNNQP
jgi:hypothetical protein